MILKKFATARLRCNLLLAAKKCLDENRRSPIRKCVASLALLVCNVLIKFEKV